MRRLLIVSGLLFCAQLHSDTQPQLPKLLATFTGIYASVPTGYNLSVEASPDQMFWHEITNSMTGDGSWTKIAEIGQTNLFFRGEYNTP